MINTREINKLLEGTFWRSNKPSSAGYAVTKRPMYR